MKYSLTLILPIFLTGCFDSGGSNTPTAPAPPVQTPTVVVDYGEIIVECTPPTNNNNGHINCEKDCVFNAKYDYSTANTAVGNVDWSIPQFVGNYNPDPYDPVSDDFTKFSEYMRTNEYGTEEFRITVPAGSYVIDTAIIVNGFCTPYPDPLIFYNVRKTIEIVGGTVTTLQY